MIDDARLENDLSFVQKWRVTMEGKKSKRGSVGEGRPTKRTPEMVARIAEAVAIGLTDEEASFLPEYAMIRSGSFEPLLIAKGQERFEGFDEKMGKTGKLLIPVRQQPA